MTLFNRIFGQKDAEAPVERGDRVTDSAPKKEVLVCGRAPESRITSITVHDFGGELTIRGAHTRDELFKELSKGQQQVCVIDHEVPIIDPMKTLVAMLGQEIAQNSCENYSALVEPGTLACNLLPDLISRSPNTRFVITSHQRGFGVSPEHRAVYAKYPQVVKVMGFVNSMGNTSYLRRLFSRVYFGKTWKPKPDA